MFVSHFVHYYVDQIEAYVDHDTTPHGANISPPLCSNKGDIYLLVTYLPTYLLTYLPTYVLTYLLTYLLIINAFNWKQGLSKQVQGWSKIILNFLSNKMSHVRSFIILVTLKSFWNKFDASYTLFGGLTYYDIKREICEIWLVDSIISV